MVATTSGRRNVGLLLCAASIIVTFTRADGQTAGKITVACGSACQAARSPPDTSAPRARRLGSSTGGATTEIASLANAGLNKVGGASCATVKKLIYGTITVDASGGVASSAELAATSAKVAAISAGDPVIVTPPSNAAGSNVGFFAYTVDDYVKITVSNLHPSTAYTANEDWNFVVFKLHPGDCS